MVRRFHFPFSPQLLRLGKTFRLCWSIGHAILQQGRTLTLDFRKLRSKPLVVRPATRPRPAPLNPYSRRVQIRLMALVVIILGGCALLEAFFTGRFPFKAASSATSPVERIVETRLAAKPRVTAESLSVISMPITPRPWHQEEPESDTTKQTRADFWKRLYESLSVKQRDHLQVALRHALRKAPSPLGTSESAELLRNLQQHAEQYEQKGAKELSESKILSPEKQAEFKTALEKTMLDWRQTGEPSLSKALKTEPISDAELDSLRAIDKTWSELALGDVRDDNGSPSSDTIAWFGVFDSLMHDAKLLENAKEVTYTEMFDQSAQLRGKPVAIRGEIRTAEYQKARPNHYGVEGYYVYWIRPENYRDAPIKVFSLAAPDEKLAAATEKDFAPFIGRQIELRGVFFKRMPYRAQDDIRAVPTVLCAKTELLAPQENLQKANESIALGMLLLVVAVIGVVLLLVYAFSDQKRVKALPEKLELPPVSIKQE